MREIVLLPRLNTISSLNNDGANNSLLEELKKCFSVKTLFENPNQLAYEKINKSLSSNLSFDDLFDVVETANSVDLTLASSVSVRRRKCHPKKPIKANKMKVST